MKVESECPAGGERASRDKSPSGDKCAARDKSASPSLCPTQTACVLEPIPPLRALVPRALRLE
ncbi:MAG: hypothetical protein LBD87_04885 [Prevotellaceae bacterium]|nr:hypothetical protein [Prevotellaceae bacterium]